MEKWEKEALLLAKKLPAIERRAAYYAVMRLHGKSQPSKEEMSKIVESMIKTAVRSHAKRRSDRETDSKRRVLVGARLPRATAAEYKQLAKMQGISLYEWVSRAFENQAARDAWELEQ